MRLLSLHCFSSWAFFSFFHTVGDLSNELVRHFLIECTHKGVRLKGCPNEPYFGKYSTSQGCRKWKQFAFARAVLLTWIESKWENTHFSSVLMVSVGMHSEVRGALYMFTLSICVSLSTATNAAADSWARWLLRVSLIQDLHLNLTSAVCMLCISWLKWHQSGTKDVMLCQPT